MQVREVMSQPVDVIDPNTNVSGAAKRMRDEDIGALPVGENDRLIGMITDRDIVVRGVAEDLALNSTTVRSIMSEKIYYCFEDESLQEAARHMAEHQVRRLPVLNRDKRLVGIIAIADIARHGATEAEEQAIDGVSSPL
jgi:CBS domain-containing protein